MPRFAPRLFLCGGATGIRTPDLLRAKQPLSHLSYRPEIKRELRKAQFSALHGGRRWTRTTDLDLIRIAL